MREATGRLASEAGWSREEAREYGETLRYEGRRLIDRLRRDGEQARADSIQQMIEKASDSAGQSR